MHFVYIDDSKGERHVCYSAICFPATSWNDALNQLIGVRREMWHSDKIYIRKEIHATDWLGGRGKISPEFVPKAARARLFKFYLDGIAQIPNVQIFNAYAHKTQEERLFDRLLNRIHINMQYHNSLATIFSDEGKNYDAMLRKLRRINYVSFRGRPARNDPLDRVTEDIVYRDSAKNFFIQSADCCAFSLLRHKHPTHRLTKYGVDQAFLRLEHVMVKNANYRDPHGIIYA